ncbi:MAG: SDR family oxidoreductase [Verrucomicrobiae bacterium]|nr:SDR family oxidoreductase [Verrucomicrobiae bacterium]
MSVAPIPGLEHPHRWLVTGVAGFIGSHLLETLLTQDQEVVGLDNFRTGHRENLEDVRRRVRGAQWARFRFCEGDILHRADLAGLMGGVTYVLHQAALGSVPQSIEDPVTTHAINVTGFLHMLEAARQAGVRRVVYASSSAVYGDATDLPAVEDRIGRPLSPYAVSKSINEQYAAVFERCYGLISVGLRYFNVFGPRQDPNGAYAAVIPRWIDALLTGRPVEIYGDGETSRDFCPVEHVARANLLAATAQLRPGEPRVFNVGLGQATTLNALFEILAGEAVRLRPEAAGVKATHREARPGDIRHSQADMRRAREILGLADTRDIRTGLAATTRWFGRSQADDPPGAIAGTANSR